MNNFFLFMRNITITGVVVSSLAILFLLLISSGDHMLSSSFNQARPAVDKILVEHGYCKPDKQCLGVWFTGEIVGGARITIYGITDQMIINQIVQEFGPIFLNKSDAKKLVIEAYSFSDPHAPPNFWWNKPIYTLKMNKSVSEQLP